MLIVEDEVIIADNIAETLLEFDYEVVRPVTNYKAAIETIASELPDIALIDIELKGSKSGIDLAQYINQEFQLPFIFLSSNSDTETLNRAKTAKPQTFLVKPFNEKELFTAIEVALHNHSNSSAEITNRSKSAITNALFVKRDHSFLRIDFNEILFIRSNQVYVDIHTAYRDTVMVRGGLGDYQDRLNDNFFRCHRSCIVNLEYIQEIKQNSITLFKSNEELPLGKKQRTQLLLKLNRV